MARTPAARALPGVAMCLGIAASGALLATTPLGAALGTAVLAMAIGIGIAVYVPAGRTDAGAAWVVRVVLPLGIVLLGARVEWSDLLAVGLRGFGYAVGVLLCSALTFAALGRWFALPHRMVVLLAVGNGICGGSAIAAAAPVLGARRDEVSASIAAVVLAGTAGTFLLPLAARFLELSPEAFGWWAGLSLQQTPQVVAAGMALGPEAGEVATTVKLARITMLVPAMLALGWFQHRGETGREGTPQRSCLTLIPTFLWGFALLSLVSALHLLPEISLRFADSPWGMDGVARIDLRAVAANGASACLAVSLAAIGLQTRLDAIRQVGGAAIAAAFIGAAVLAVAVGLTVLV